MIPRQKDIVLAVCPHRHLSSADIIHAIGLQKGYGNLRRRIFCNTYWIVALIWRLKRNGLLQKYQLVEEGKVVKFDRPRYCLTPQGNNFYGRLSLAKRSNSPYWA